jgi:hypothetical protein
MATPKDIHFLATHVHLPPVTIMESAALWVPPTTADWVAALSDNLSALIQSEHEIQESEGGEEIPPPPPQEPCCRFRDLEGLIPVGTLTTLILNMELPGIEIGPLLLALRESRKSADKYCNHLIRGIKACEKRDSVKGKSRHRLHRRLLRVAEQQQEQEPGQQQRQQPKNPKVPKVPKPLGPSPLKTVMSVEDSFGQDDEEWGVYEAPAPVDMSNVQW